jgi:hypothetical protein
VGLIAALSLLAQTGWEAVEAWRRHRDKTIKHQPPTYDVYPDRGLPPQLRLYVEGRDARGRLLREYVDLEGYSLHQLNFRPGQRRGDTTVWAWFIGQVLEAQIRLSVRLDVERERRETP